ncbi:MAG TPA: MGMT family protein [Ruminiclostridium sp.]|nr:MGMT family protein [Ruminiclostridium sp.]
MPIKLFATTFQLKVYEALIKIPYGNTVSYGELAHLSGRPGGARAVGGALKSNPIPVIVPCHRVICSDGTLGGFCGDFKMTDLKNSLLKTEGITAISKKNWRNEI